MVKTYNTSSYTALDRRRARKLAFSVWKEYASVRCEISLNFVPEAQICELNERYLGKDTPTDVIAFNLGPGPDGAVLGDVYICPRQAESNARRFNCGFDDEVARLVIHGMLHMVGFDDATLAGRQEMQVLEARFLSHG